MICVLPGLCGAAKGSVGSSPDKDFQPCVQQEDIATKERMVRTRHYKRLCVQYVYKIAVGSSKEQINCRSTANSVIMSNRELRDESRRPESLREVLEGVAKYASVRHVVFKAVRVCECYRGSREEAFTGTDSSLMFFLP